jgi:hypothetical protein
MLQECSDFQTPRTWLWPMLFKSFQEQLYSPAGMLRISSKLDLCDNSERDVHVYTV